MKVYYKSAKNIFGAVALGLMFSLISCTDTTTGTGEASGPPQLDRVSLVNKDSTTTEGTRGLQVVIFGNNLAATQSVKFSGAEAEVNSALATNDNIIVSVPGTAPYVNASDSLVVTNSKGSASLPFHIAQPPATLDNFSPKYAEAGDTVTITGDVFVNVSSVTFGEKEAQIISSSSTQLKVKVPDGVSMIPKNVDSNSNTIKMTTPGGTVSFAHPFGFKFKVYDDALGPFYKGSYGVNTNFKSTEHVAGGKYAIETEYTVNYGALLVGYYGSTPDLSPYSTLEVSVYGGKNAGKVKLFLRDKEEYKVFLDVPQGEYKTFYVSLEELGNPATINQLQLQTNGGLFTVFVDNIGFY